MPELIAADTATYHFCRVNSAKNATTTWNAITEAF